MYKLFGFALVGISISTVAHSQTYIEVNGPSGNKVSGSPAHFYGQSGLPTLRIRKDGDLCYLENEVVRVVSMIESVDDVTGEITHRPNNYNETFSYDCSHSTDSVEDFAHPVAASQLNDALHFGSRVVTMYLDEFGIDLLEFVSNDPLDSRVVLRVHAPSSICGGLRACWPIGANYATFPDGRFKSNGEPWPTVVNRVTKSRVAHEITHPVIRNWSNLLSTPGFVQQSWALAEGFCDIMGNVFERWDNDDWDPEKLPASTRSEDTGTYPYNHYSSSVNRFSNDDFVYSWARAYRHAFYWLSKSSGWDVQQAAHVFMNAQLKYWRPLENFSSGVCGVEKSSIDLLDDDSAVTAAFAHVGLYCPDYSPTEFTELLPAIRQLNAD